jgi:la-related protein 1
VTKHALACNLSLLVMMSFSDSNLDDDDFLKSLMDENGWVPVSKVADFNRV